MTSTQCIGNGWGVWLIFVVVANMSLSLYVCGFAVSLNICQAACFVSRRTFCRTPSPRAVDHLASGIVHIWHFPIRMILSLVTLMCLVAWSALSLEGYRCRDPTWYVQVSIIVRFFLWYPVMIIFIFSLSQLPVLNEVIVFVVRVMNVCSGGGTH